MQALGSPPAFPIRKHVLLVSGCHLLQLATPSSSPKTAWKTTISFSLRRGEKSREPSHTLSVQAQALLSRAACS